MHSLRLPGVPLVPPSFKRQRLDSDSSRFSLNLSLSKPIPTPGWASLPSPPMSGSPPSEPPFEPPPAATSRRRKRSDTPTAHAPSTVSTPVITPATIVSESRAERRGGVVAATTGINIQPATWPTPYTVSQSVGFSGGASVLTAGTSSPFPSQYVSIPSSPKSTRKSKVHVPSACVNCKKKHLRCDNSRPCHRCLQSGKEVSYSALSAYFRQLIVKFQDSCVDVQHKKRGRPPLRPDDQSSRNFPGVEPGAEAGLRRASLAGSSQPDPSKYSSPYQRPSIGSAEMLQQHVPRQGEFQRPHMHLAPSPFGMYAPPSVSSTYATASGTTYNISAQRPPSSSSSLPSSQPPSPHYQTPSTGTSPEGPFHSARSYRGGYGSQTAAQEYYPQNTGPYNVSLFPRPQAHHHHTPFEVPASVYTPQQSIAPELQLPPIRPAPPGTYTNPAMAQQQQRQAQQQQERESRVAGRPGGDNGTRQPDPKRPRMSLGNIVNPRND